jgi:hypothetical protein
MTQQREFGSSQPSVGNLGSPTKIFSEAVPIPFISVMAEDAKVKDFKEIRGLGL